MATLDSLKHALRQKATSSHRQPLSEAQYSAGFKILTQSAGWLTYQDFIIPQLSQLLGSVLSSRLDISVLEIGPGPRSLFGCLSFHLKRRIAKYAAFEPNGLFASELEQWFYCDQKDERPLPCLQSPPDIFRTPFGLQADSEGKHDRATGNSRKKYDVILFCHSMYGMQPKRAFIEKALGLLVENTKEGMVVVFHREGNLQFDGLVCHRTASFPDGVVRVPDEDELLDCFAAFISGFVMQDLDLEKSMRIEWRKICRALGRQEAYPKHFSFSAPDVMVAFTRHAVRLPELTAQVPLMTADRTIKNSGARQALPVPILRPTDVQQIRACVQWSLKYKLGLTILGGGHSDHCLRRNIVSVDMSAFDQLHIITTGEIEDGTGSLVVAESGCKMGDIIRKTMAEGVTVPMGSRPSVGAGMWLQGGIGHLARLHGLACDAIVGAVLVSVDSGQVLYVGCVPSHFRPNDAVRPENENDLLWAIKGAGTNLGVVVSVTFKTYTARTFLTRKWSTPFSDDSEACNILGKLDEIATIELPVSSSVDVYLYWDTDQFRLGATLYESSTTGFTSKTSTPAVKHMNEILGPEKSSGVFDGVGLFETEMYMSEMHGGHSGGKTSSFKRCIFLKSIGKIAGLLIAAMANRPSNLCYLHLLQGGGAVAEIAIDATAFGCRDWDFACVVTGLWARNLDGTAIARAAVQWVYGVIRELLPLSSGVYGADLGPDPRDVALAASAYGPNRMRLARLKHSLDPHNLLSCACPLPKLPRAQKLILLVTGESGAGKDYCADTWVSVFKQRNITARVVSISDATKQEYAVAVGADFQRLLSNRAYKEQHRSALTTFYQEQVQHRPRLPEEHFSEVTRNTPDTDVLLVTGMRDKAPVASFSHLVPHSRLLEIRVLATKHTRQARRGGSRGGGDGYRAVNSSDPQESDSMAGEYCQDLAFDNDIAGGEAVRMFAERHLLLFFQEDFRQLANMVGSIPDFPRPGVGFRHVLDISQHSGGLPLCVSLLQGQFAGDWSKVGSVACCESGGFVFGSALALRVNKPLALIREVGKLPPPTLSAMKVPSYISSLNSDRPAEKMVQMSQTVVSKSSLVVVVDDVLATGETLCATLELLQKASVSAESISVIVVAEFPFHQGRTLLRRRGFGKVRVQSLLVFGGA